MPQIRITKTPQMQQILEFMKNEFPLFSESDIVKLSLSKTYNQLKAEKLYYLTPEGEKGLDIGVKEIEQGKGFTGTAEESIEWLES